MTGPSSTRKPGPGAKSVTIHSSRLHAFNCESACGLLAYIDKATGEYRSSKAIRAPGSRGRNCAKGPATLNQITDPDRILYPLKRAGKRGAGHWEQVSWDEVLDGHCGAHSQSHR